MERIGDAGEFETAGRKLVKLGDREVMVFAVDGEWYAYENRCPHAGGPVCQGRVMPRVTVDVLEGGKVSDFHFSDSEFHIVCPWHAWEFDIRTGISATDKRRRLRRFKIEEREDGLYASA